jgi:hypothetical protein
MSMAPLRYSSSEGRQGHPNEAERDWAESKD